MLLGLTPEPILDWKTTAHDHNFWLDMILAIANELNQIIMVSFKRLALC
jgi:hypothetical protein